jgi:hypothetical protein
MISDNLFYSLLFVFIVFILVIFYYLAKQYKENKKITNPSINKYISDNPHDIHMTTELKNKFIDKITKMTIVPHNQEEKILTLYLSLFYLFNENYNPSVISKLDKKISDNVYVKMRQKTDIQFYDWSKYSNLRSLIINIIIEKIYVNDNVLTDNYDINKNIITDILDEIIYQSGISYLKE